jgi:5-methylcytosine-specific restriction enzyme B
VTSAQARSVTRTATPVRSLSADELDVGTEAAPPDHGSSRADEPVLVETDQRLSEVLKLLEKFGGVILTGPPGTSKSWYAAKIGTALVEQDRNRVKFVQFHPSYQYEDFIQGFVPRSDGHGFDLEDKIFVEMCVEAEKQPDKRFVLVIDELSRGDPGRIFGEALTYIERSKRTLSFTLASGRSLAVPQNLFLIATMNPFDKGVDEVDAAFERRFAKIAMDPDRELLADILERNSVSPVLANRILGFFSHINSIAERIPQAAVGHAFFIDVVDEQSLSDLWQYQLRFLVERAFRLDPAQRGEIEQSWQRIFEGRVISGDAVAEGPSNDEPAEASG